MDLKSYLNIVNLLQVAESDLGLDSMTESDRSILLLLWNMSNSGKKPVKATYEAICDEGGVAFSRAQFYKTLRKASELGMIERIGSPRSASYEWVKSFEH
jgi:hypothetical protein